MATPKQLLERLAELGDLPDSTGLIFDADWEETEAIADESEMYLTSMFSNVKGVQITSLGELKAWLIKGDQDRRVVLNGSVDWKKIDEVSLKNGSVYIEFY